MCCLGCVFSVVFIVGLVKGFKDVQVVYELFDYFEVVGCLDVCEFWKCVICSLVVYLDLYVFLFFACCWIWLMLDCCFSACDVLACLICLTCYGFEAVQWCCVVMNS